MTCESSADSPVLYSQSWHTLEIQGITCKQRHVVRDGNGCNPQIHRADTNALFRERGEGGRSSFIVIQDLKCCEVGKYFAKHAVGKDDVALLLALGKMIVPAGDLLVKGNDRYEEVRGREAAHFVANPRQFRFALALQDDQVIRVEVKHSGQSVDSSSASPNAGI